MASSKWHGLCYPSTLTKLMIIPFTPHMYSFTFRLQAPSVTCSSFPGKEKVEITP